MKKTEIKIPKGCKATMYQDEDKIVIEYEEAPKFKRGDFVATPNYLFIFSHSTRVMWRIVSLDIKKGKLLTNNPCDRNIGVGEDCGRLMTSTERQQLLDALHAVGKDWDAEKMEIVDLVWRPKHGEPYYTPDVYEEDLYSEGTYYGDDEDLLVFNRGLGCKTKEEAIKRAERMLNTER